jgi:N-acetylglutamate synthase-like GNAT family acetyltransferase
MKFIERDVIEENQKVKAFFSNLGFNLVKQEKVPAIIKDLTTEGGV